MMGIMHTMHGEVTSNTHSSSATKRPEIPISLLSLLLCISILTIHPAHVIPFLWLRIYICVAMHAMCLGADPDTARDVGEFSERAGWVRSHSWLTTWNSSTEPKGFHQHGMKEGKGIEIFGAWDVFRG